MEAKELMIGGWVCIPDSDYSEWEQRELDCTHYYQVESIDSKTIGCTANEDGSCDVLDVRKVQPIPLTAELLQKNGFEKRRPSYNIGSPSDEPDVYELQEGHP